MFDVHDSHCTFDLDVDFKCSVDLGRTSHVSWMMDRSSMFMDIRFCLFVSVRCCFLLLCCYLLLLCLHDRKCIQAKAMHANDT